MENAVMNFSLWVPKKDVYRALEIEGYQLISVCMLLKKFGYKTGKEAKEKLQVKDSFLRCKLAYKNERELETIYSRFSYILEFIKTDTQRWCQNAQLLCVGINDKGEYWLEGCKNTCYSFKAERRFDALLRKQIKNKYDLNIWTRDE